MYIYIYIYSSTYIEVHKKIKQGSEILSKCRDLKRSYPFPWKIAVGPAIPVTSRRVSRSHIAHWIPRSWPLPRLTGPTKEVVLRCL